MRVPVDSLIHAHILLGMEQKKQLRVWAADRDTSMAALIREAIDYYLRVAMGPNPTQVRRAARYAAGVLPRATDDTDGPLHGGPTGEHRWAGES